MKRLLIILLLYFTASCNISKIVSVNDIKQEEVEEPNKYKNYPIEKYNFWNFNGNGKNYFPNKSNWQTSRIAFSDSTLISDGIYENSGRFDSEKASVYEFFESSDKHSIAIRFKNKRKKKLNPLLVGGKFYRWIKIHISDKNSIYIQVAGNNNFSLPNEQVKIKNLTLNNNEFNTLFLSWNIKKSIFYIALNNSKPQIINIPKDFKWAKKGRNWTIQDYASGVAFEGELDYFLSVNDYLTRAQMSIIIKNNLKK